MSSLLWVFLQVVWLYLTGVSLHRYIFVGAPAAYYLLFEDDVAFALSVGQLSDLVGWLSLLSYDVSLGACEQN